MAESIKKINVGGGSTIGGRTDNQDNFLLDSVIDKIDVLRKDFCCQGSISLEKEKRIFMVCDGMGGKEDGQIASKLAVEYVYQNLKMLKKDGCSAVDVYKCILGISEKVTDYFKRQGKKGGTTLSYVQINKDGTLELFNIGDSPVWLIRNGQMKMISDEQSLAGQKLKRGQITEAEYEKSKEKSVLMHFIGDQTMKSVMNAYYSGKIELTSGDVILMASDGLAGALGKDKILKMIAKGDKADALLSAGKQHAKTDKNTDNITAIMLEMI